MANIEVEWEVEGIISPKESIESMLKVLDQKNSKDSGTFWCWDGRVCTPLLWTNSGSLLTCTGTPLVSPALLGRLEQKNGEMFIIVSSRCASPRSAKTARCSGDRRTVYGIRDRQKDCSSSPDRSCYEQKGMP